MTTTFNQRSGEMKRHWKHKTEKTHSQVKLTDTKVNLYPKPADYLQSEVAEILGENVLLT